MEFASHLSAGLREHFERRLRENLLGWSTSVRPSGQPECAPDMGSDTRVLLHPAPRNGAS